MSEYTVKMLKFADKLALSPTATEQHLICHVNGLSPRRIGEMPAEDYISLRAAYAAATVPKFYRLVAEGLNVWRVMSCDCDCVCWECTGLERKCGDCDCEEPTVIGRFPQQLLARHLIDGGDDSIGLTEHIMGRNCDDMSVSDFRTMQLAIMARLRKVELPLAESPPEPIPEAC